jgi:glycosyltransferase involved in cell wall biosynthesis
MPLFSVIVPIYNIEDYVGMCIDSILSQTFTDFEVILVDDGSTDKSGGICDSYRDSRIIIIQKENGGLVSARKAGVKNAKGTYVVCVDGDDWISEDYLENYYNVIKQYKPDIICTGSTYVYTNKRVDMKMAQRPGFYNDKEIKKEIYPILLRGINGESMNHTLWGKCILKELYLEYQMMVDESISVSEDAVVFIPCVCTCNSVFIMHGYGYFYRKIESSMTAKGRVFSLDWPENYTKYLANVLRDFEEDFSDQIYRLIAHSLFNASLSQFNRTDSFFVVKKEINEALEKDYYVDAIRNCSFKNIKEQIALFVLKHKLFGVMNMMNSFRKNRR